MHVDTSDTYPPLPESAFRRFIAENYMSSNSAQFSFELDMEQVARLSEAFKHFAVNRTTPIPHQIPQNAIGTFPQQTNTAMMDRPSQAWLSERTRRLSPVGRRPGMDFLNYGRPRSSMDYLGAHQPQHFETDFSFLGNSGTMQQPRLSFDVNTLSSLLGATNAGPSPLLGNADLAAQGLGGSRLFSGDGTNWNTDGLNLTGMMAQMNENASPPMYNPAQLGLAHDPVGSTSRLSMGRLSPGHLSPDLADAWSADATANAFKMAAQRLTPDIHISQAAAVNISPEEKRRANIWQVNSKDMGLVGADKLLSGATGFPEMADALQEGAAFNGLGGMELGALQEQSRLSQYAEGLDPLWSGPNTSTWKPPRPHSSTDGEVQNLTKNLQNMWPDSKAQVRALQCVASECDCS